MGDLQGLVDELADRLGRPVGVDDRRLRAAAYSSHAADVDRVRLASILQREAPGPVVRWLSDVGIATAGGPVRLPANPALGMHRRVCVPLRLRDRVLGFLWLLDEPPFSPEELEHAERASAQIALALDSATRAEETDREAETQRLRVALGQEPGDAAAALEALAGDGALTAGPRLTVVSVLAGERAAERGAAVARLASAATQERRFVGRATMLTLDREDRTHAVIAHRSDEDLETRKAGLVARLGDELADLDDASYAVGISTPREGRSGLSEACREADLAAGLVLRLPELGGVSAWGDLGAYRLLARLIDGPDPAALVPEAITRLLEHPEGEMLTTTLVAYLESGCDARLASEELFVHRSSLYHRLHRIEEVIGGPLSSGDRRLELHLGLRLWHLAGRPLPA